MIKPGWIIVLTPRGPIEGAVHGIGAAKKEFIASSSLSLLVRSPEPFQP